VKIYVMGRFVFGAGLLPHQGFFCRVCHISKCYRSGGRGGKELKAMRAGERDVGRRRWLRVIVSRMSRTDMSCADPARLKASLIGAWRL